MRVFGFSHKQLENYYTESKQNNSPEFSSLSFKSIYHKHNPTNAQNNSISGILVYNLSNNSTTTSETFRRENYRIVSGNYAAQSDTTDAGNAWDSTESLSVNGGLLYYNERLYYPTDSGQL